MLKQKEKIELERKLTICGRFVAWADEIKINKKIITLLLLIGLAGFAANQEGSNWDMFRIKRMAKTDLPQFAPKKDILASDHLLCNAGEQQQKNILGNYSLDQFAVIKNIEQLVKNKPMENMVDAVAQRDTQTATYLVAIAKKESNLGAVSPKSADGKDCYNYWGFPRGGGQCHKIWLYLF